MKLIAFTGPAGSGKDTCGRYLSDNYGYTPRSFAYPLKSALQAMGFGWPETHEQKEAIIPWLGKSYRHLAQTLGTEWGRQLVDPEIWTKIMEHQLLTGSLNKYTITDLRFENEAALVRRLGGIVVHLTDRNIHTGNDAHASEQRIAFYGGIDFYLANNTDLLSLYSRLDGHVKHYESR